MNSDDEDRDSSNRDTSSMSDEDSDTDIATVLTQLIRSGRAHILSERNSVFEERNESFFDFLPNAQPPPVDSTPDLTVLEGTDLYLSTSLSSGIYKHGCKSHSTRVTSLLYQRQVGMKGTGHFSGGDRSYIGHNYLPNKFKQVANCNHKMFCGTYSKDGNIFLSASQDRVIRVFDTSKGGFDCIRKIPARDVGWSILDTAFSPDGRSIIYSSWSEAIHLCNIYDEVERHEVLPLSPELRRFCIFSLTFSQDGNEVLGGANDGCLYIYDCEKRQRTLRIDAHEEDVNTVAYADETSQILFSGADDGLCKVWDRRTLAENGEAKPVGILGGHVDGLTFVDSRGDGRHLITNSKDQSIKLWDMRKFSGNEVQQKTRMLMNAQSWDYSFQNVPWRLASPKNKIAGDTSLMTYRGHSVLRTLIRCRFSPAFSTGQRYIYSGCAAGKIFIYDVLTGKPAAILTGHSECVRDVSWHPYSMDIIDSAWDGRHFKWFHSSADSEDEMDLDTEEYITDSESNDSNPNWMQRQRRSYRDDDAADGGGDREVRRSPRLAARATPQTARRTSQRQRQAASRRPLS
ncbi:DDB1- and CUL4-associated factor 11-like isoform X2 [Daphnia pulex]|uniref:DDB1- and CUL4-associated factor 11-like isoform X2 n=1 Tax=Daphnia pulex TaxID=6669 RepID=UPI001EDCDB67|nr:DDB1- and CUL4-associated factor 11-like isoform X2 [Daphnia pulex]XP_046454955.1 DDB1- and CUL4-associated factor 11-like isoform X2 [Daphnia pulex]